MLQVVGSEWLYGPWLVLLVYTVAGVLRVAVSSGLRGNGWGMIGAGSLSADQREVLRYGKRGPTLGGRSIPRKYKKGSVRRPSFH